ncbi:hypothetical protein [Oleiharenicola lentus]|uniref:hypothetical protein n=1 Tax=Oleiharenicola lentus TaxID=2508720 RepID=UPI003F664977
MKKSICLLSCLCLFTVRSVAQQEAIPRSVDQVIASRGVQAGEKTVTYRKVAPRVRPVANITASATRTEALSAPAAVIEDAIHTTTMTLFYSTTSDSTSEISWSDQDGEPHHLFSNLDFGNLPSILAFQVEKTYYLFSFMPGRALAKSERTIANLVEKSATEQLSRSSKYDFLVPKSEKSNVKEADVDALAVLHAYYTVNYAKLVEDKARREEDFIKQQADDEKARRAPVTINYWRSK